MARTLGGYLFFEGSEKKIEVAIEKESFNLKEMGDEFWERVVKKCNAEIISKISSNEVDAYLLSESSLFVWTDRFVMITCGRTKLIESIKECVNKFGRKNIEMLIYQRKNEYYSHLQETSFLDDIKCLKSLFSGTAYRFGPLDGHHNFVFHLDKTFRPRENDKTSELLMYHIGVDASEVLTSQNQTTETIRDYLGIKKILKDWIIDDYVFRPFGYSLNGLYEDNYITMHVTPQEGSSYISFETSIPDDELANKVMNSLIEVLRPTTFDVITFNRQKEIVPSRAYYANINVKQPISCGYNVEFKQYSSSTEIIESAVKIDF